MNCKIENCTKRRVFSCEQCKESSEAFSYCVVHAKKHSELSPSHSLTRVCIQVDELTSVILINRFQELVIKAQSARVIIVKKVNTFMKKTLGHTNFALTQLHNAERQYHDAIRLLQSGDYIDSQSIIESDLLIKKLINDEKESENEVKKIEKTKQFLEKIKFKKGNILEMTKKLKELEFSIAEYTTLKEIILKNIDMRELVRMENTPLIHYLDNHSSKLVCTNVVDGSSQLIPVNGIKQKITPTCCCCYIDNQTFFTDSNDFGPQRGSYYSSTSDYTSYIIDLKSNRARPLKFETWGKGKGCCYYKSTIYLLGGYDSSNKCLNNFECCSIAPTEQICKLAPLPDACSYISCEGFQNKLYYVGYNSRYIITYEILTKVFKTGFYLSENTYKLLLYADGIIFLIESGKVYKYEIGSLLCELVDQGTLQIQSYLIAPPTFYKDKFYFIQSDKKLYSLNIKSYKLNFIRDSN